MKRLTGEPGLTPITSARLSTCSVQDWQLKYGEPSPQTGLYLMPPLPEVLQDLVLCGGSLRKLVDKVAGNTFRDRFVVQVLQMVSNADADLRKQWDDTIAIGTRAKLLMGKDQMLDEWERGTLKNATVLQSVARNLMPEVFGKEREPEPSGPTPQQQKLAAHILDLEE